MCEILIPACHGAAIDVKEGQTIAVIDIEGAQVVDFFAERAEIPANLSHPASRSIATNRFGSRSAI